jgi:hypothetical protein
MMKENKMQHPRQRIIQHNACKEIEIDLSSLAGEPLIGIARELTWADRKRVIDLYNDENEESLSSNITKALALQVILSVFWKNEHGVYEQLFQENEEDFELLCRRISIGLNEIIKPLDDLNGFFKKGEKEKEGDEKN